MNTHALSVTVFSFRLGAQTLRNHRAASMNTHMAANTRVTEQLSTITPRAHVAVRQ
jgi:hypothetical protein